MILLQMLYKQEFNSKVMKRVESSCVYITDRLQYMFPDLVISVKIRLKMCKDVKFWKKYKFSHNISYASFKLHLELFSGNHHPFRQ